MIKVITTDLIKQFNPCQSGLDNWIKVSKNKPVSLSIFLDREDIPNKDKIWLLCRIMPRDMIEVFAIDQAFAAAADAAAAAADAAAADAAAAAAYVAYVAAYAADAAAAAAADAAADAAAADAAADAAAYAADDAAARAEQVQIFKYLINNY